MSTTTKKKNISEQIILLFKHLVCKIIFLAFISFKLSGARKKNKFIKILKFFLHKKNSCVKKQFSMILFFKKREKNFG